MLLREFVLLSESAPRVHEFRSTGDAYNQCQWNDEIKIGDTLVIPKEEVVGIAHAWPIAVTEKSGNLHTMKPGRPISSVFAEDGLTGVVEAAVAEANKRGWPLCKEAH